MLSRVLLHKVKAGAPQSTSPSTSLPASKGASKIWTITPSFISASRSFAPPSVPQSAFCPPCSGKKAVRSKTTAKRTFSRRRSPLLAGKNARLETKFPRIAVKNCLSHLSSPFAHEFSIICALISQSISLFQTCGYVLFLTVLLFTCTSSIDSLRICRFVFRTSRLLLRFSLCVRFRVSSLRIYRFVFRTSHLLPASRSSRYACSRFVLRFYAISSCLRRFVFLTVPKRQPPGGKLSLFSYCAALIAARSSS